MLKISGWLFSLETNIHDYPVNNIYHNQKSKEIRVQIHMLSLKINVVPLVEVCLLKNHKLEPHSCQVFCSLEMFS